jgi:hypothetical protein
MLEPIIVSFCLAVLAFWLVWTTFWGRRSRASPWHEELAERVRASPHKILVSSAGGEPRMDYLYRHCRRFSTTVRYHAGVLKYGQWKPGEEVLYANW